MSSDDMESTDSMVEEIEFPFSDEIVVSPEMKELWPIMKKTLYIRHLILMDEIKQDSDLTKKELADMSSFFEYLDSDTISKRQFEEYSESLEDDKFDWFMEDLKNMFEINLSEENFSIALQYISKKYGHQPNIKEDVEFLLKCVDTSEDATFNILDAFSKIFNIAESDFLDPLDYSLALDCQGYVFSSLVSYTDEQNKEDTESNILTVS